VFLGLSFKLLADEQGEHLMVESSFMGMFARIPSTWGGVRAGSVFVGSGA